MDRKHRLRIELLTLGLLGVFGLLFIRCYYIQQVRHEHYRSIADRQHLRRNKQVPRRGAITDRNGVLLAISRQVPSVWGNPSIIDDPVTVASKLSGVLGVAQDKLLGRLSRKRRHFVWLSRHVSADVAAQVKKLDLAGIGFRMEAKRSYPHQELAAHILGFCGTDQEGLEGVEKAWDQTLAGRLGSKLYLRDGRLRYESIHMPNAIGNAAVHGAGLQLTIDLAIQRIVELALDSASEQFRPKRVTAIVMQVGTGEILALAQRPTFDPNHFRRSPRTSWRNGALLDMYEPGSTIKPLVASFALAERLYSERSMFDCTTSGRWRYRGRTIEDHKAMGRIRFADVVVHSSNIGIAKMALALGSGRLASYLTAAGFGRALGQLRFPGLPSGQLKARPATPWNYWSLTSVSFGYELMVSPMQLIAGINMLASGGVKTPPRLVRLVRPRGQKPRPVGRRLVTEQVVPRWAAHRMCRILGRVVAEGTGRRAKLPYIKVGGKTGTAKMINPDGTYSSSRYRSSFVGFAPLARPVVTVMVM